MIKLISSSNGNNVEITIKEFESIQITINTPIKPERLDEYTKEWRKSAHKSLVEIGVTDYVVNELLSGRFDHNPKGLKEFCKHRCLDYNKVLNIIK